MKVSHCRIFPLTIVTFAYTLTVTFIHLHTTIMSNT